MPAENIFVQSCTNRANNSLQKKSSSQLCLIVEGKRIHGTRPFIFFTVNVNSDNNQREIMSELPQQQKQRL